MFGLLLVVLILGFCPTPDSEAKQTGVPGGGHHDDRIPRQPAPNGILFPIRERDYSFSSLCHVAPLYPFLQLYFSHRKVLVAVPLRAKNSKYVAILPVRLRDRARKSEHFNNRIGETMKQ